MLIPLQCMFIFSLQCMLYSLQCMLILHRQIKPHIHICPWMYRQQPDSWPCGNLAWWKWICNVSSVIKWCWLRQWKCIVSASNSHWKRLLLEQRPYPGELTIRSKKPLMQWISRLETAKCKFIWYWFLGFAYPWSAHKVLSNQFHSSQFYISQFRSSWYGFPFLHFACCAGRDSLAICIFPV